MIIRLYVTGPIAAERDGVVVMSESDLRGRQARLLFAYLALERRRTVSRTELMTLIWPEGAPEGSDASLSVALSRTRAAIAKIPGGALDATPAGYRLTFADGAWLDFDAANEALDSAESLVRSPRPRDAFGPSIVASTVARRALLPDLNHPWVTTQRDRLKRVLIRSLEALALVWLDSEQPHLAEDAATEIITLDPLNERGYQLLMESHCRASHPAAAIQAYHRLRDLLKLELGIEPSAATEQLYVKVLG